MANRILVRSTTLLGAVLCRLSAEAVEHIAGVSSPGRLTGTRWSEPLQAAQSCASCERCTRFPGSASQSCQAPKPISESEGYEQDNDTRTAVRSEVPGQRALRMMHRFLIGGTRPLRRGRACPLCQAHGRSRQIGCCFERAFDPPRSERMRLRRAVAGLRSGPFFGGHWPDCTGLRRRGPRATRPAAA